MIARMVYVQQVGHKPVVLIPPGREVADRSNHIPERINMKSEPIIPPVFLTATYKFKKTDDLIDVVQNRSGFIYSRWDNPIIQEAEKALAQVEDYDHALAFGSGVAAISTSIFALLRKGSRIVYQREIYGGTFELLNDIVPRLGIETSLGGVASLANQPITNTHAALSPEARAKAGIGERRPSSRRPVFDRILFFYDEWYRLKA